MRLIDADALQALFNETITSLLSKAELQKDVEHVVRGAFLMTTEMIKGTLTVDAVEVVRCKDCKYWGGDPRKKKDGRLYASCRCHSVCDGHRTILWEPAENDFCSCGKRRGE